MNKEDQIPNESFTEWASSLSGTDGEYRVKVSRLEPTVAPDGTHSGHLADFNDFTDIDEDYLKTRWGGGKYEIKILRRNEKSGSFKYFKTYTLKISGPPKWEKAEVSVEKQAVAASPTPDVVKRAIEMAEGIVEKERERGERLEERLTAGGGKNDRVLELMMAQLESERDRASKLENKINDLFLKMAEPKGPQQDTLLQILATGKNTEITAMAERHRSEMEALRQNYENQLNRQSDGYIRQIEALREDSKRTMDSVTRAHDMAKQTSEISYQNQLQLLNMQLSNATTEVKRIHSELDKLRSEKQKSFIEQMKEMASVKDMMESLGLSGNQEETSGWEKALEKVGEIGGQIFQAARQPNGQPPPPAQRQRALPEEPKPEPQLPSELVQALQFTEHAIANGTDPTSFAQSAATMVPSSILSDIIKMGADNFADQVAAVQPSSLIGSQKGRKFLRTVVSVLSGSSGGEA